MVGKQWVVTICNEMWLVLFLNNRWLLFKRQFLFKEVWYLPPAIYWQPVLNVWNLVCNGFKTLHIWQKVSGESVKQRQREIFSYEVREEATLILASTKCKCLHSLFQSADTQLQDKHIMRHQSDHEVCKWNFTLHFIKVLTTWTPGYGT